MRRTKNIAWGDGDLTVKELTMQELIDVLGNLGRTADHLDLVFHERLPSEAVVISSGIPRTELLAFPPSRLDELWKGVEEVNPFFLDAVRGILRAAPAPSGTR